jgi:hypothetical protein
MAGSDTTLSWAAEAPVHLVVGLDRAAERQDILLQPVAHQVEGIPVAEVGIPVAEVGIPAAAEVGFPAAAEEGNLAVAEVGSPAVEEGRPAAVARSLAVVVAAVAKAVAVEVVGSFVPPAGQLGFATQSLEPVRASSSWRADRMGSNSSR